VESSDRAFESIAKSRAHTVKYEDFVAEPERKLHQIVDFLGIDAPEDAIRQAVLDVTDRSVGKWRHTLCASDMASVEPQLRTTLEVHGYL